MTEYKNMYGAYNSSAQSVGHMQQLLMLYDGSINFLKQAEEAIKEKNYEKRYNLVNKVCAIVSGLRECIDFENGGDVSLALSDFYLSIDLRLVSIQGSDDIVQLRRVIKELEGMRDAWRDVALEVNGKDTKAITAPVSNSSDSSSDGVHVNV